MRRVGVAVDVYLNGGVDSDDAEAAYDGRVVGNLALAQCQVVLEVVYVVVHLLQTVVADG